MVRKKKSLLVGVWLLCLPLFGLSAAQPLPRVEREMRAMWIVTAYNLDWPSNPNLSSDEQQRELLLLLEAAQNLNLNAVFFQVRPAGDSFYQSHLEPWSKWLTGREGRPPEPFWDPLAFAIEAAHQRGLELHAWLNPYRAGRADADFFGAKHLLRKRPDLLRNYQNNFWLDPGEPEAQDYVLRVVTDIVSRYQLDGVHIDDYFYPYPQNGESFNDRGTYQLLAGNAMLDDWRRDNVNRMILELGQRIKIIDPAIIFGVSPFAIWQDGIPTGVSGMNSYDTLYSDSRKWLVEGWVDYLAPQFYWPYNDQDRLFTRLFRWWEQQNLAKRGLFAGINVKQLESGDYVDFDEIRQKIEQRRNAGGDGDVFYSAAALRAAPWRQQLLALYSQPALPPVYHWLDVDEIDQVKFSRQTTREGGLRLNWQNNSSGQAKMWLLYALKQGQWDYYILPGEVRELTVPAYDTINLEKVALQGVNRANQLGASQIIDLSR